MPRFQQQHQQTMVTHTGLRDLAEGDAAMKASKEFAYCGQHSRGFEAVMTSGSWWHDLCERTAARMLPL